MDKMRWMTVARMGEMLGLKKTGRYWLIHKNYFETKKIGGKTVVDVPSFEKWYANQIRYHKVCGTEPGLELRRHSYSARDISILLNIHEQTAYDLIRKKGLKTILVDGWKRVPKEDFDRWFNSQSEYKMQDFPKEDPEEGTGCISCSGGILPDCGRQGDLQFEGNGKAEPAEPGNAQETEPAVTAAKCPSGYFSRKEAAIFAGVTELTVLNWARMGHFPQRKSGNRIYIPEKEFKTWLNRREEGGSTDGIALYEKREV